MRYSQLIHAFVVTSSIALFSQETKAIQFDFSSVPGSGIRFTGQPAGHSDVTFDLGISGRTFQIDAVTGGTGSAAGYQGNITGIFDLGPVTTVSVVPLVETAPVSGSGTFSIFDGVDTLTATLGWFRADNIKAIPALSAGGVLGTLSGVSYSGTDPDLQEFASGNLDEAVLSFLFLNPGRSLAELTEPGTKVTSFSGNVASQAVSVPDSGATLILLGMGLCGLAVIRR